MAIKKPLGERIFGVFNIFFMLILLFIVLYPLYYFIIASVSNPLDLARGMVRFTPSGFELASYRIVSETPFFWSSYANSVFYATVGTAFSMVLTVLGGYALSKRRLRGRKFFTFLILLHMWFGAGMVPHFLNFRNLGLLDTRAAIILAFAVSTFNVILMRVFFENVPESLEESAKIDGAKDLRILGVIYLPLSIPAIATVTMFYFIERWNAFFWPALLVSSPEKMPLQVLLRRMVVQARGVVDFDVGITEVSEQTVIYAAIVLSVIPLMCIYPFIQRFFVKGVMLGAIKG